MVQKKVVIIRNAAKTDFGGGERVPVFIAQGLKDHGIDSIILSHSQKLLDFAKSQGVKHKKSWWWAQQDWSGKRALLFPLYITWQFILFGYYVILFIFLRPSCVSLQSKDDFVAGTFAARMLGIRVFWIDHGDLKAIWLNHRIWYKNPVGKLVYFASRGVNTIAVASKNELGLISANIPSSPVLKKFKLIYNGTVDSYKKVEKSIDFISTARLVEDKGISELIDAFAMLVKKHPTATLAIIGDGPDRDRFIRRSQGIPGIKFYGHQTDPLKFLEKSKIFILPTHHEAFGVAVVEACMEGLAIVATDIGGIPEIVEKNKSGILVPVGDTERLYKAMCVVYKDVELQKSLGSAARSRFVKKFNFSEIIKNDYLPLFRGHS